MTDDASSDTQRNAGAALPEAIRPFVDALVAGAGFEDRLHDHAVFESLTARHEGKTAVAAYLTGSPAAAVFRRCTWRAAPADAGAYLLTGQAPADAATNGFVLLVQVRDGRVARVGQQLLLPAKPPPASALVLPGDLRAVIDGALLAGRPMILTHVDEQGWPVLSFRGSTQVFSDDQLAIWVRNAQGGLIRSIAKNPWVALMYRDQQAKATYQFRGKAWVSDHPQVRGKVYEASPKPERDHDFATLGAAMIIDLEHVEGYAGLTPAGPIGRINLSRQR
jgi:hypothetical protein